MPRKIPPVAPLIFLKSLFFFFTFLFAVSKDFSVFSVIVFFLVSGFLYIRPIFNTFLLRRSFLILLILSLVATSSFVESPSDLPFVAVGFAFLFSALFYLLIGIKNLILLHRKEWHYFLSLALIYISFILFFAADKFSKFAFISKAVILFIVIFFLVKEFLVLNKIGKPDYLRLLSWLLTFLILEGVLVISLIPIGVPNAASLAVLFSFAILESTQRYFASEITTRFLKLNLSLFAVLTLVIFLTSGV